MLRNVMALKLQNAPTRCALNSCTRTPAGDLPTGRERLARRENHACPGNHRDRDGFLSALPHHMKTALYVILAILGFVSGGWMLFDGLRRMLIGDYVRIDGQLGPWRHVVTAVGVDPMARGVAVIFVLVGVF